MLFFQNTHNAQLIRWRNTIHRTLIFILLDPLANRGHSISKWLLMNSCCFLKNANSTESRFWFCCAFFQNTHNAQLMAEHYSQDSYLYFIRSIGQQRALYIKMASFKLVLFSKKRKQHRIEIFVLLCFFQNTHNAQLIRWRNTIHRTLIFILLDPLANRGHSISKWLLMNSCCFLKNANSTESRFWFCCDFFQNTQRTTDIRWRNTTQQRTFIFIYKAHQPIEGTVYQNGFF